MSSTNGGAGTRSPVRPGDDDIRGDGVQDGRRSREARSARQGAHVIEMQRRRLLTATSELIYERGVQAVTIALVSDRAGVSRKTFYAVFGDREGCLLAVFEDAVRHAREVLDGAIAGVHGWRERVRTGLVALLSFLDEEPVAGRLLVVEALGGGECTLKARARVLGEMIAFVEAGRAQPKAVKEIPPLTAEGVVGAVFSVIHARMLDRAAPAAKAARMVELTGALTAMVIQPYLGPAAARRELERPAPAPKPTVPKLPVDPFRDLPIRLTYRTALVLAAIAATPGASGKRIARASEVTDDGQMSRLLARLERVGLIENAGPGPAKGEANAWVLTSKGRDVQTVIAQQTGQD
jgi:AcrR family transcriptional regulator